MSAARVALRAAGRVMVPAVGSRVPWSTRAVPQWGPPVKALRSVSAGAASAGLRRSSAVSPTPMAPSTGARTRTRVKVTEVAASMPPAMRRMPAASAARSRSAAVSGWASSVLSITARLPSSTKWSPSASAEVTRRTRPRTSQGKRASSAPPASSCGQGPERHPLGLHVEQLAVGRGALGLEAQQVAAVPPEDLQGAVPGGPWEAAREQQRRRGR